LIIGFDTEAYGHINFRDVTEFDTEAHGHINFRDVAEFDTEAYGHINFGIVITAWFPVAYGHVNFSELIVDEQTGEASQYFGSMTPEIILDELGQQQLSPTVVSPSSAEYKTIMGVRVYLQVPELPQKEIQIPYQLVGNVSVSWKIDKPVLWSLELCNFDRRFTDRDDSTWGGLLTEEGVYSPQRETRKFFKIVFQAFYNGKKIGPALEFPRLVIDKPAGGMVLNFSGSDEVSYYLYSRCDLTTYCTEECLIPIGSSKGSQQVEGESEEDAVETYTKYKAFNITNKSWDSQWSNLMVNFMSVGPNDFNFDEEISIFEFKRGVNARYPVSFVNPLSVKETMTDICKQIIDKQPAGIEREYINLDMNDFTDFRIFSDLTCQNRLPAAVLNDLLQAIPGEMILLPRGGRWILKIRPKIYKNYPTVPRFLLPEALFRDKPLPDLSAVKAFNKINVIRPSVIRTAVDLVTSVETQEEGG